jgi:hypothetical protein
MKIECEEGNRGVEPVGFPFVIQLKLNTLPWSEKKQRALSAVYY